MVVRGRLALDPRRKLVISETQVQCARKQGQTNYSRPFWRPDGPTLIVACQRPPSWLHLPRSSLTLFEQLFHSIYPRDD